MVRRVLKYFYPIKDDSWKDQEINRLRLELFAIERSRGKIVPIIEVGVNDPEPTDETQREAYVAEYARFFDTYLEKKLKHLIAYVREDLDWNGWPDTTRPSGLPNGMSKAEYDWFLRGTSNAFRLLLEYGEQMKAENIVNNTKEK